MNKFFLFLIILICYSNSYSQKILVSWSQQNIENYTKDMYNEAQKYTALELLNKNLKDKSWSAVFLTLNASINNYSKDTLFLQALTDQITDSTQTKLEGTSRLIIWDRIISGDILFEGKGLVIENDLFKVCGRANQILQSLTNKNFGFVTKQTTFKELENLKSKWLNYLSNKSIEEYQPAEYKNSKINEITSLTAINALIISLHDNVNKQVITKNCLKKLYKLDEMPKEKDSPANFCNPDSYTLSYLNILFSDKKVSENKDAKWWIDFWEKNKNNLSWNNEKGIFIVSE